MALIQEDFRVAYDILKIGSIKAWDSTSVDGQTYPPSVKIRATNIEEKMDAKVGIREIETIIDFQISTTTLEEANLLQEQIRKFRADKKTLHLLGNLPKKEKTDEILKIKSSEPLADFLERNNIVLSSKQLKK